jgi:hypothetical protein
MADQEKPEDEQEMKDLQESAKSMGVDDVESKDADEIVEEVRHTQTDSESSPSGWKAEREEDGKG